MNSIFPVIPPQIPSNMHHLSSDETSTESLSDSIEVRNLIINEKDKENTDYLCPICKEFMIPDECIELHCGHLFCKKCIYSVNTNLSLPAKCPLCNKSWSTFTYIKTNNKFAYKILCNIKIHCPNKGCCHDLFAGDLKYHIKKCDFVFIDCSYCDEKNIYRKDIKKHYMNNMEDHFFKLIEEVADLKLKIEKKE
jgi:hypothetical protein